MADIGSKNYALQTKPPDELTRTDYPRGGKPGVRMEWATIFAGISIGGGAIVSALILSFQVGSKVAELTTAVANLRSELTTFTAQNHAQAESMSNRLDKVSAETRALEGRVSHIEGGA